MKSGKNKIECDSKEHFSGISMFFVVLSFFTYVYIYIYMYIYIYTRVSVVKCSNKTNFLRDSIRL